jgi:hypothetical protein
MGSGREERALPVNSMGIKIEIFQFIYIGLTALILSWNREMSSIMLRSIYMALT